MIVAARILEPEARAEEFVVGHYVQGDTGPVRGFAFVARELTPGALAPPVDYEPLWDDTGSGAVTGVSFWMPVPGPGYRCLGAVARGVSSGGSRYDKPSLDSIRCVREDLTTEALAWRRT